MKRRFMYSGGAIIFVICIGLHFFNMNDNSGVSVDSLDAAVKESANIELKSSGDIGNNKVEPLQVHEPSEHVAWGSKEDKLVWKDWLSQKGYDQRPKNDAEYQGYSIDTLEKLMESGDVRAMHMLAYKLYKIPGQGFSASAKVYKKAMVYGDTRAINEFALMAYTHRIAGSLRQLNEEEKKSALIDVLSLFELAKLRGDRRNMVVMNSALKNSQVDLTTDDWVKIRSDAGALYNSLLAERQSMGLGNFDNSVPEPVARLHHNQSLLYHPEVAR